jgi:hypothetical protein
VGGFPRKDSFRGKRLCTPSVDQSFLCGGSLINEKLILTGKFSTIWEIE